MQFLRSTSIISLRSLTEVDVQWRLNTFCIKQALTFCIQCVSKLLGQISGVTSPHKANETCSCQCSFLNSFRNTVHQPVQHSTLDFYLWPHLQTIEYSSPIENEETLQQRILFACHSIRNLPGTLERVRYSTIIRVYMCIDSGGGYFEHLLLIVAW